MTYIKDLKEHERLTQPLLVKEVKNGTTTKGSPYLSMTLQDKTGFIDAKMWDAKDSDQELVQTGKIINFTFEVLNYKDNLQLRVNRAEKIDENNVNLDDFVISSENSEEKRRNIANQLVMSIQNEIYKKLVIGVIQAVGDKYFTFPAASKIHHSWFGGLSDHSLSMATLADTICQHYPQLNRDLLVSAALIHDVGKTVELSGPVTTEYTLAGKLEGHISIGNEMLDEVAKKLNLENEEETILMHHMVLSHHGKMEFGSPVVPMLMEAEVLSLIDNMDARITTLTGALANTKEGQWTSKLFSLENRQFYKPNKK